MKGRAYLGDGVYVAFDGFGIELTTDNGNRVTNRIVLEPHVWAQLKLWVERFGLEEDLCSRHSSR